MSRATQQLRVEFKIHLEDWEKKTDLHGQNETILAEIKKWSLYIEKFIENKIKILSSDFSQHPLKGEYLRSVTEGFEDLERIMRTTQTLADLTHERDQNQILLKIKTHYTQYLVPLLNILAKLENDYVAVVTQAILDKGKLIETLEKSIDVLTAEQKQNKNSLFALRSEEKFLEMTKNIQKLELQKKITRLTLLHDRLNLYYFNHDRPKELSHLKDNADKLRAELRAIEEPHEEK